MNLRPPLSPLLSVHVVHHGRILQICRRKDKMAVLSTFISAATPTFYECVTLTALRKRVLAEEELSRSARIVCLKEPEVSRTRIYIRCSPLQMHMRTSSHDFAQNVAICMRFLPLHSIYSVHFSDLYRNVRTPRSHCIKIGASAHGMMGQYSLSKSRACLLAVRAIEL